MSEKEKRPSDYLGRKECLQCGAIGDLHQHHLDWNHDNNDPSNVVLLCETCHTFIHRDSGYLTRDDILRNRAWIEEQDPNRSRRDRAELVRRKQMNRVEGQMDLFD